MIPVLVPRRADGGRRDELWAFVRQWWEQLPEFEIIEGHHDVGPFNRSAAINGAALEAGDWDVAVIADADVVAPPAQIEAAVARARETGRMTLAFTQYAALNQPMTDQVLAGYSGNWGPGRALRMLDTHVSSVVAIPRPLWDRVGGFDPRFVGWGHDDVAFAAACRVLGGGIDRTPGTVWHLWHPFSPERSKQNPARGASAGLAQRYFAAVEPDQMRALIAERVGLDAVALIVITDGRRDCIAATIAATDQLKGLPITRRVIHDDSGDIEFQAWLRLRFPGWELVCTRRRAGFAGAVSSARSVAIGSGQPWIFWLEDDFILDRPVDLAAMAAVLRAHPHVLQMALRRQAWFPAELEAGGVIEQNPDGYQDCRDEAGQWLEHELFWTTNPHLIARDTLTVHPWPPGAHSEARFARQVLTGGARSGYWGARTDAPWVTHIGEERVGAGY